MSQFNYIDEIVSDDSDLEIEIFDEKTESEHGLDLQNIAVSRSYGVKDNDNITQQIYYDQ